MRIVAPLLIVFALAVPAAANTPAAQTPAVEQRSLEVEVAEAAAGGKVATPMRMVVPLVVDAGPSEMQVREGGKHYRVVVAARRQRGSVVVELTLERRDGSQRTADDFEIKVSVVQTQGTRAVLAAAERPDGSRIEVAGTLK